MKKFKLLAITGAALVMLAVLAGCASMQLVSLDSAEGPKQVRQGMDINPKDITVYGIYKDESRKTINMKSDYIVFDRHTPGPQTVKLRISGKEIGFETEVMPLLSLAVAAVSQPTQLFTGDTPDSKWPYLEIRGEWEQLGSGKIDTASCQFTGYNKEQVGNQTITVSFEGKTTAFNINVAQSHPLKGEWVRDFDGPSLGGVATLEFKNDGTYGSGNTRDGTPTTGTYTTDPPLASEGKITMTLSYVSGISYAEQYGCLPGLRYTRSSMETAIRLSESKKEEGQRMTDAQINVALNGIFTSRTRDYAIRGDKLFLDGEKDEESEYGVIKRGYVRK